MKDFFKKVVVILIILLMTLLVYFELNGGLLNNIKQLNSMFNEDVKAYESEDGKEVLAQEADGVASYVEVYESDEFGNFIGNFESLITAIEQCNAMNINNYLVKLVGDTTSIESDIIIQEGKNIVLDLNGKEIFGNIINNGNLIVKYGTITIETNEEKVISNNGTLTVNNATIEGNIVGGSNGVLSGNVILQANSLVKTNEDVSSTSDSKIILCDKLTVAGGRIDAKVNGEYFEGKQFNCIYCNNFNMTSGEITINVENYSPWINNYTTVNSEGICCNSFNMENGTITIETDMGIVNNQTSSMQLECFNAIKINCEQDVSTIDINIGNGSINVKNMKSIFWIEWNSISEKKINVEGGDFQHNNCRCIIYNKNGNQEYKTTDLSISGADIKRKDDDREIGNIYRASLCVTPYNGIDNNGNVDGEITITNCEFENTVIDSKNINISQTNNNRTTWEDVSINGIEVNLNSINLHNSRIKMEYGEIQDCNITTEDEYGLEFCNNGDNSEEKVVIIKSNITSKNAAAIYGLGNIEIKSGRIEGIEGIKVYGNNLLSKQGNITLGTDTNGPIIIGKFYAIYSYIQYDSSVYEVGDAVDTNIYIKNAILKVQNAKMDDVGHRDAYVKTIGRVSVYTGPNPGEYLNGNDLSSLIVTNWVAGDYYVEQIGDKKPVRLINKDKDETYYSYTISEAISEYIDKSEYENWQIILADNIEENGETLTIQEGKKVEIIMESNSEQYSISNAEIHNEGTLKIGVIVSENEEIYSASISNSLDTVDSLIPATIDGELTNLLGGYHFADLNNVTIYNENKLELNQVNMEITAESNNDYVISNYRGECIIKRCKINAANVGPVVIACPNIESASTVEIHNSIIKKINRACCICL